MGFFGRRSKENVSSDADHEQNPFSALEQPSTHDQQQDLEKNPPSSSSHPSSPPPSKSSHPSSSFFPTLTRSLLKYNVEARGIQRVPPSERHPASKLGTLHIFQMWFSINLAAILITLGMLGPTVYLLSFTSAGLLAVFSSILGALPVGYIATFGPRSGNRTMILTRYVTGWWPSKLIVVLTLTIFMGYGLIDTVIGGQILSAVSSDDLAREEEGGLSIVVGIVIISAAVWLVSVFGYAIFHAYERYAWLPQLVVLAVLAGVAGQHFDLGTDPSEGLLTGREKAGNRLSFFSLCMAAQITYAQAAADFFVYYPVGTPSARVFGATVAGLAVSSTFALVVGVGLASGIAGNPAWADAYAISQGALIVEALRPLGGFGGFCGVVVALSLVGNMVPPTYACGIDFQALGRLFERVPRIVWNSVAVLVPMICAIAGREHLAEIFTNFLALMGYWVSIWIAIVLEEHLVFRRWRGLGWDWEVWNDRNKLPLGVAALIAFLVGWAGAILCMAQVWYVGPLARLISEYGGDMGNYVGFSWAAVVYPPMRWLELKKFGR